MCKWYCVVANLLRKVKFKYMSAYEPLRELCDLRDGNIICSILNINEINHLIQIVVLLCF